MSGNFIKSGNGDTPNTSYSSLEEDCVPVQARGVQEDNQNAPSQFISTRHANVADSSAYTSRNPLVLGSISIFKNRHQDIPSDIKSQDIAPQPRDIYTPYKKESERIKTYHDWPSNSVVDKVDLARNGFIYLHMKDRVQCVFCRGVLSSWERGDIVKNEHKQHCPECPFAFGYECGNVPIANVAVLPRQTIVAPQSVRGNLPVQRHTSGQRHDVASLEPSPHIQQPYSTIVNIPVQQQGGQSQMSAVHVIPGSNTTGNMVRSETNALNVIDMNNRADCKGEAESLSNRFDSQYYSQNLPSMPSGQFSMTQTQNSGPINEPKYKAWEVEKTRIKSFKGWPAQMTQTPRDLAAAGLLYMGNGDRCKCYWCGGELYDWEPEDTPWEEHAKWFPQCGYVRKNMGVEYIQYVQDKQNGLVEDTSTQELMHRPHVLAVLSAGYTQEQVQEVFHRFGMNKLVDARSIMNAIEQTKREREAARSNQQASSPFHIFQPSVSHEDVEMPEYRPVPKGVVTVKQQSSGSRPGSACSVSSKGDLDVETVFQENERLKDQKMCKICMDNDVCMMFKPCNHLVTCEDCSHSVIECPMCRNSIADRVKVFWA